MGVTDLADVLFSDGASAYESRPVGSFDLVHAVTLTRVEKSLHAEGGYIFAAQEPAELANIVRTFDPDNPDLAVRRLEIKCRPPANSLQADDIVVCTEHPYSSFWAAAVPLRRGYQSRIKDLSPPGSRVELERALETASVDWWETTGRLTAAIEEHMFHKLFAHRRRASWQGRRCVLGVVPGASGSWRKELHVVETALCECSRARKLRSEGEQGLLRAGRGSGRAWGDATAEANALLWFSIRQALAGPREKFDEWIGCPVMKLAERIFRDNMHVLSSVPREHSARGVELDSPEMQSRDKDQADQFLNLWRAIGREDEEA